jgi:hypothetical protein
VQLPPRRSIRRWRHPLLDTPSGAGPLLGAAVGNARTPLPGAAVGIAPTLTPVPRVKQWRVFMYDTSACVVEVSVYSRSSVCSSLRYG